MAHDHLEGFLPGPTQLQNGGSLCDLRCSAARTTFRRAIGLVGRGGDRVRRVPPSRGYLHGVRVVLPRCLASRECRSYTKYALSFTLRSYSLIAIVAGAEPEAIATAPVAAENSNIYPLVAPQTPYSGAGTSFQVIRSWGNLSPWFSVGSGAFGLRTADPQVPAGCELEQVHLLHRHGARYPTSGSAPSTFAAKVHGVANSTGFSATGPLDFLNSWTYKLGAEILTPFGREQL